MDGRLFLSFRPRCFSSSSSNPSHSPSTSVLPSIPASPYSNQIPHHDKQSPSSSSTAANACKLAPATAPPGLQIATFAGGCFWGLELAYQREPGVTATSVGYTQGKDPAPTYEKVCNGSTGHAEAVQVYYDPEETSYERLLALFFERVDPTTANRQGNDVGTQYRSGIYYHDDEQKQLAEKAIADVNAKLASNVFRRVLGTKVESELLPATDYFLAEDYHQQYLSKGGGLARARALPRGARTRSGATGENEMR